MQDEKDRAAIVIEMDVSFEITDEMINAGAKELRDWDERVSSREEGAEAVFRAMLLAYVLPNPESF